MDYSHVIRTIDNVDDDSDSKLSNMQYEDNTNIFPTSQINMLMTHNSIALFNNVAKVDKFISLFILGLPYFW